MWILHLACLLENALAYYFCLLICNTNQRTTEIIEGTFFSEYNFRFPFTHSWNCWGSFTLWWVILAYIQHTYNLIFILVVLIDYLGLHSGASTSGRCSRVVPYCSFILELSAVLDSCNLFPRPSRHSGIAYDSLPPIDLASQLRPLTRYGLWGHFAAFWPMYLLETFVWVLALRNLCSGNFILDISYWGFFILVRTLCTILPTGSGWAASRPSAHYCFEGRLVSFDPAMDCVALL